MLSDSGIGDLELGDSLKQARALGFVGENATSEVDGEVCAQYPGEKGLEWLYFTDDQLIIIAAGPTVRLDTGVGVGDTFAQLNDAYGDRISGEDSGLARLNLTAPDAPFPAFYRVGIDTSYAFRDSKIIDIALQSIEQGCYE
ncbi:hypothetical protein KIH74_07980 [Kineosporia sp. J2-2]|uniref:Uncharacterized protein n=1 Tax=Kineosporia corallincola TaxID=2835133 RepID=A0ABS5TCP6_9ACTN|nr:hypothetical protein [Kineosporia corallincola]MBT0768860.1 hypothetical protein [Kineosporia corallincola]